MFTSVLRTKKTRGRFYQSRKRMAMVPEPMGNQKLMLQQLPRNQNVPVEKALV
jgi:hypothetical protein